jgi:hypothetical protein
MGRLPVFTDNLATVAYCYYYTNERVFQRKAAKKTTKTATNTSMKNKKEIVTICIPCGNKNDRKQKQVIGCWIDTCDMCGKKNVSCASAPHDFGIYSNKKVEIQDKIQDML